MGAVLDWLNCKQLIFYFSALQVFKIRKIRSPASLGEMFWLELKLSNPSSGGRAGQAGGHDTHSGQGEFQLAGGPQL